MHTLSELIKSLNVSFKGNKARLFCLANCLLALIRVRSVNLKEIAVAFMSQAQVDSRYKRLYRFFSYFQLDHTAIARWIFALYQSEQAQWYLTIDRTNWFWGKSKINYLIISMAYEGMAIPLFWQALDKAGNASAKEHIAIIQRFVDTFGTERIAALLGDREFASHELFHWLQKQSIPFCIRIKDNAHVAILHVKKGSVPLKRLFRDVQAREQWVYPYPVTVYGVKLALTSARSDAGELMVVATHQPMTQAIAIYLRRWEIETLFSCLKQRGFRFENTRLTQQDRLEKLMALLAMATAWVHRIGEWRASIKPIRLNRYRDGTQRPKISYFRLGLDFIRELLFHHQPESPDLLRCIQLLQPNNQYLGVMT